VIRHSLLAAVLCAGVGSPGAHAAEDRPATIPTRDVDVTYQMARQDATAAVKPLEQRMRWAVSTSLLRVDPPIAGIYVVMNYKTHRLDTIREKERMVVEMDASGAGLSMGAPSNAKFTRKDDAMVAGLPCTEWETRDVAGQPALACLTADGVLLRAVSRGRTLIEASTVHYGPIDSRVFDIPASYKRILPPTPGSAPSPVPATPAPGSPDTMTRVPAAKAP
jgi:hypothetical protein